MGGGRRAIARSLVPPFSRRACPPAKRSGCRSDLAIALAAAAGTGPGLTGGGPVDTVVAAVRATAGRAAIAATRRHEGRERRRRCRPTGPGVGYDLALPAPAAVRGRVGAGQRGVRGPAVEGPAGQGDGRVGERQELLCERGEGVALDDRQRRRAEVGEDPAGVEALAETDSCRGDGDGRRAGLVLGAGVDRAGRGVGRRRTPAARPGTGPRSGRTGANHVSVGNGVHPTSPDESGVSRPSAARGTATADPAGPPRRADRSGWGKRKRLDVG